MKPFRVMLISLPSHHSGGGYAPAMSSLAACAFADPELRGQVIFKLVNARTALMSDLEELVADFAPDMVGFSVLAWNEERTIALATSLREELPEAILLAGGDNAAHLIDDVADLFDLGIVGEGELSFLKLLKALVGRGGGARSVLQKVPRGELRAIPGVRLPRDPMQIGKGSYGDTPVGMLRPYHALGYAPFATREVYLESLRGCPYHCTFCGIADATDKLRHLDERVVEREIAWAAENQLTGMLLCDSAINYRTADAGRLANLLERHFPNGGFALDAQFNFDFFKAEQIPIFKRLPVEKIACGLQTTNPKALAMMNRHFNRARFEKFVEAVVADMPLRFDLILGLPGDDPEGFLASLEYLSRYPVEANVYVLNVLPQTEAWRQREAWGLEVHESDGWLIRQTPTFSESDLRGVMKQVRAMTRQRFDNGFRVSFEPNVLQTEELTRDDDRLEDPRRYPFPIDPEIVRGAREVFHSIGRVAQAPDSVMNGWRWERSFVLGIDVGCLRLRDAQNNEADLWVRRRGHSPKVDLTIQDLIWHWDVPYEAYLFEPGAVDAETGDCSPIRGPLESQPHAPSNEAKAGLLARLNDWLRADPILVRADPLNVNVPRVNGAALVLAKGASTVTLVLEVAKDENGPAFARGLGHALSYVGSNIPLELKDLLLALGRAYGRLDKGAVTTEVARNELQKLLANLDPSAQLSDAARAAPAH